MWAKAEKFRVGETVLYRGSDMCRSEVTVIDVHGDEVTVAHPDNRRGMVFVARPSDGKHVAARAINAPSVPFIQRPTARSLWRRVFA